MSEAKDASASSGVVATRHELVALARARLESPRGRAARAATLLGGPRASRFRGRGMEFSEVRAYQAGDDVRTIDWRVTARTGRPHSKLFEEERERPVWLIVDLGPSMRFGTRRAFKSVAAARAAAVLAWEAHGQGERVGGVVVAPGSTVELPPARPRRHMLRFLDVLASGTEAAGEDCDDIGSQLRWLASRVRAGGRVVVISDFYGHDEELALSLRVLSRRCEVTLVHVFDALECTPPPSGRYRVSDGSEIRTVTSGRGGAWQQAVAHAFEVRSNALRELTRRHRIELVPLRTDEDPVQALSDARRGAARVGAA